MITEYVNEECFKQIQHVGPNLLSDVMHCRIPFGEVLVERLRTETAFVAHRYCVQIVVKNTHLLTRQR